MCLQLNENFWFRKIISLFQFCGFCPFNLENLEKPSSRIKLLDLATQLWLLVQFIFSIASSAWAIHMYVVCDFDGQLDEFNDILRFGVTSLTYMTTLIESFWTRNHHRQIVKCMELADSWNQEVIQDFQMNIRKFHGKLVRKILMCLILSICSEIFVIANIHTYSGWLFAWSITVVPLMMSRIRHMQHMLNVEVLGIRFKLIKRELKQMAKLTKLVDNSLIPKNQIYQEKLYQKISTMKKIYSVLWECSLLINQSFGFSLLTNMLQNFIQLTYNFYWIYSILYTGRFMFHIKELIFQIIPTIVILVVVLSACERCLEQARSIGFHLHNIEKDSDDDNINILMENFSLQLLHEPLIFSASGFFELDFMLLKSMIGSITVYIVILIQFMPKDEKGLNENIASLKNS